MILNTAGDKAMVMIAFIILLLLPCVLCALKQGNTFASTLLICIQQAKT